MLCEKERIYKTNDIKICSSCIPSKIKLIHIITNCIDCKRDILKPSERCGNCDYKITNNLDSITSKYCKNEEYVKKGENWKKNCKDCYKKLVVTKQCITSNCYNTVTVMPDESWKTKCRDCY